MMLSDTSIRDVRTEADALACGIQDGNPCASYHLARLIQADERCALAPFAEAVWARLRDHLARWAEQGITDIDDTLEDELYLLFRSAAIDWNGLPCRGRPGEEA